MHIKFYVLHCMYVELTSPSGPQHCLCSLAHLMGASIRKDITSSVTHIVAHSVSGSKYKVYVTRMQILHGSQCCVAYGCSSEVEGRSKSLT